MVDATDREATPPRGFRWRGRDITRIEAFSDAVFAFALTLLVVSLEVPRSLDELMAAMSGFLAFAACFTILIWLWYEHYRFFRKYGLTDGLTIVLNAILLFVVLFYVYPLKFLFTFLSQVSLGLSGQHPVDVGDFRQVRALMIIYGAGFVAVFILFTLLHFRALYRADALELTALERYDTRSLIAEHALSVGVGVLSIALAFLLPARLLGISGFAYALLGPVHAGYGAWNGRRRRRVATALEQL
jgi:uncharacterized membrane protein